MCETQLRRRTLDREVVTATMLRIVTCGIRAGSEIYAGEDSFGLSTLSRRHVTVSGRRVQLLLSREVRASRRR